MDHDEPDQVHTIDMDKDWKLHKHRGSAGLHVDPEPQNSALVDHEVFTDQLKDGCGAALRAAKLRYDRRIAAIAKLDAAGTMSAAEVAVERNEARWRLDATNSHIYNSTNVRDVDHMGHEAPSKRGLVVEDSGRQEEGDMFRTNKINMLPLVRLDLSKLDVVNLIANFFCSWRDNLVGTGESGLLDRMGIFVTCDGQPARATGAQEVQILLLSWWISHDARALEVRAEIVLGVFVIARIHNVAIGGGARKIHLQSERSHAAADRVFIDFAGLWNMDRKAFVEDNAGI
jgi:hypothetical protein